MARRLQLICSTRLHLSSNSTFMGHYVKACLFFGSVNVLIVDYRSSMCSSIFWEACCCKCLASACIRLDKLINTTTSATTGHAMLRRFSKRFLLMVWLGSLSAYCRLILKTYHTRALILVFVCSSLLVQSLRCLVAVYWMSQVIGFFVYHNTVFSAIILYVLSNS